MNKRTFGRTGLDVSPLGFGGAPVGYLGTERRKIATILNTLLDRGVNLIDTAECYPGSEEAIGEAVSHRRDEFVLVTKCGHTPAGLTGHDWEPRMLGQSIDLSLKRLRTDRLDVVLLHSCSLDMLKRGDVLNAVTKARDAGKVRFAGYSGDNEAAAYAATLPDVAVIETSISIADQANIASVLPVCREHNVGVIAKRPVANAAWKPAKERPGLYGSYGSYGAEYERRLQHMGLNPDDLDANFRGHGWPEIALRLTLSLPGVHTAIIGTTNPDHAATNIEYASRGPLPSDVMQRIQQAFNQAEQRAGVAWTGQT
jgi:aryl-alcohol dehydrogenase-like predicted oxidoreductase